MTELASKTTALIELLLRDHDICMVRGHVRERIGVLVSHRQVHDIYERIAKGLLKRRRASVFRPPADPPADFKKLASVKHNPALAIHYKTSVPTITRWRRETGAKTLPQATRRVGAQPPEGFAEKYSGRSVRSVAAELGMSAETVSRWFRDAGMYIAPRHVAKPVAVKKPASRQMTSFSRPLRDGSQAGMAADHLRRLGPVYRCDSAGKPDFAGKHWRRGSAVLSDDELIERAERAGWQADAWKTLPTPAFHQGA